MKFCECKCELGLCVSVDVGFLDDMKEIIREREKLKAENERLRRLGTSCSMEAYRAERSRAESAEVERDQLKAENKSLGFALDMQKEDNFRLVLSLGKHRKRAKAWKAAARGVCVCYPGRTPCNHCGLIEAARKLEQENNE